MVETVPHIILASGSPFRRRMLEAAGLEFQVTPADVDEAQLRRDMMGNNKTIDPSAIACQLAEAKALDVSRKNTGAIVIGADQILAAAGQIYSKPPTIEHALEQLKTLQGRQHNLHTAVVLASDGYVIWAHVETAIMTMRSLTSTQIRDYLAAAGPSICQTVGGYEFEGRGVQLFEKVDGDHFTIIGLPLLPLLAELRRRGEPLP
jgi:septum formation protein